MDFELKPGAPVAQFEIGKARNFVYVVADWAQKRCAIVDPHSGLEELMHALKDQGLKLSGIWLTHSHWDHTAGLPELGQMLPQTPLWIHPAELHRIKPELQSKFQIHELSPDLELPISGWSFIHTPGHSAGGGCFHFKGGNPPLLLTGDTLFIRDCGRTDLDTGNDAQMFESLQRLKTLNPQTVILPGHHYQPEYSRTLAEELVDSPPLQARTIEELARL